MATSEITERDQWVKARFEDYIRQEGRRDAYLRGLHYFIVTIGQDDPRRQIPLRGKTRTYRNTQNEYKNLSSWVVDARLKGLIPFEMLTDNKNEKITQGVHRRRATSIQSIYGNSSGSYDATFEKRDDWEDFLEGIYINYERPSFWNQDKRLVVIIEKSKARSDIISLCQRHGADFIQFGGQHSLTRLWQLTELAQKEEKPMRVFHLVDLDITGWFMPQASERRIQELYPDGEHEFIRISLTREQVKAWNLPISFEPDVDKNYAQGLVDKFIEETGSIDCIELDAVPKSVLLTTINDALSEYSGLKEDEEDYKTFKDEKEETLKDEKRTLFDEEFKQDEYNDVLSSFNDLIDEINEFLEERLTRLEELGYDLDKVEEEILDRVRESFPDEEE